jgi:hypothetical protein
MAGRAGVAAGGAAGRVGLAWEMFIIQTSMEYIYIDGFMLILLVRI